MFDCKEIKTAEQAREYIESNGIEIVRGIPYNIYSCGCICRNDQDIQRLTYFNGRNRKLRTCPEHKFSEMVNKYKMCSCGREYWSRYIQASEKCQECHYTPKEKKEYNKKYHADACARRAYKKSLKNEHLRDPERSDCIHYQAECVDKYIDYKAVPCKNCKRYIMGSGDVDSMGRTYRNYDYTEMALA